MSERRGEIPGASAPKALGERTAPTWVKVLVGLHVFATTVWALPKPPPAVMEGKAEPRMTQWLLVWNARYLKELKPVRAYLMSTGAWQYWDMFAPDPVATDWYCTAEVTYRDGSTKVVAYPRIADLPIPLKYVKERYRKFYERAHDDRNPLLWPAFAQAMALRGTTDPQNPPTFVRLRVHSLNVADPGKPQPKEYDSGVYYTYVVDQAWLKRALR